jgi:hypothetical protein
MVIEGSLVWTRVSIWFPNRVHNEIKGELDGTHRYLFLSAT